MVVPGTAGEADSADGSGFGPAALQTLVTRFLVAALSFVSVLIVARTLGVAGRGDVALLTTIAMVSSQLARLGVDEATINLAGRQPRLRGALATNAVLFAGLLGGACIALLALLIGTFPGLAGETEPHARWLALGSIPLLILQPYLTFLIRADFGFKITNLSWVLAPLLTALVNGILAGLDLLTVTSAFATWVGAHGVATALLAWYVMRRSAGFGRPSATLARQTLGFGLRAHPGRALLVGNYRVDQWFVGALAGSRELGLYSIAVAWAEVLFYLPTVLVIVQRPFLVRSSLAQAARRAAAVFRAGLLLTLPLVALMILLAPFLCATIFGAEFEGAVDDLRVLAAGAFGIVALQQLGNALIAQRWPGLATAGAAVGFAVTIALDVALIPHYGGLGAAVASTLAYTAGGVATAALFVQRFHVSPRALIPRARELPALVREIRSSLGRGALGRRAEAEAP